MKERKENEIMTPSGLIANTKNYNEENNMPKYLKEIYQLAEDLNIELEFIFPSHFEIILSNKEYEHIYETESLCCTPETEIIAFLLFQIM